MKRVMVSAIVFVALFGVAFVLRSRPASLERTAATDAILAGTARGSGRRQAPSAGNGTPIVGVSDG